MNNPTRPSSGIRPSNNFTKEVGITPLGHARLTISWEESIPKQRRTETQIFAFLDLFFLFHGWRQSQDGGGRRQITAGICWEIQGRSTGEQKQTRLDGRFRLLAKRRALA